MKRLDVKQNSHEWRVARVGVVTASCFHRVITAKARTVKGKDRLRLWLESLGVPCDDATLKVLSISMIGYCGELCAEWILGEPLDTVSTQFMERGHDLEDEAVRQSEWDYNCDVDRVGFCLTEDGRLGCSPDGLVGEETGLEVKNLGPAKHVVAWLTPEPDSDHVLQVQGCLLVTGFKKWVRMYNHPSMLPVYVAMERDESLIADLRVGIGCLVKAFDKAKEKLLDAGHTPQEPKERPDVSDGGYRPPEGGPTWDEAKKFAMEEIS